MTKLIATEEENDSKQMDDCKKVLLLVNREIDIEISIAPLYCNLITAMPYELLCQIYDA